MEIETKEVRGGGMVIGCGMVMVPRSRAESNQAVPSVERVERAKSCFNEAGLTGATLLIETIQMLENEESVVGYFGYTLDRDGLTRTPLAEGETFDERGMKIMCLPHPQWGNRFGTATVVSILVSLSDDPGLKTLTPENLATLNQMFSEGATFLAQGSSEGES